jgi:hypothetical protein
MANPNTLRLLMLQGLSRADLLRVNATTGDLEPVDSITEGETGAWVNAELAALWDVLVSTYEDYAIKREKINVVAGIEDYSMPSDFYKFRKVFPIQSGRRCAHLRKFDLNKLGEADSLSAILTSPIEETRYRITGNRLFLHPVPTAAAELELWYVQQFDVIYNLDDAVDFRFPTGWEQYVVEGVAANALEKEDLDSTPFRTRQEKILGRIIVMAEDRDVGEPHLMQDTEGYLDVY